jgi:hypothetical protein
VPGGLADGAVTRVLDPHPDPGLVAFATVVPESIQQLLRLCRELAPGSPRRAWSEKASTACLIDKVTNSGLGKMKPFLFPKAFAKFLNGCPLSNKADISRRDLSVEEVASTSATALLRDLSEAVVQEFDSEGLTLLMALNDIVYQREVLADP